jgi:hypothetical protein
MSVLDKHILAYLLKSRTVEPEKRPLLGNGCVTRNNKVTVESGVFFAFRAEAAITGDSQNCAGGKQKSCKIMRMNMFAV